jgi:hypothetical protein
MLCDNTQRCERPEGRGETSENGRRPFDGSAFERLPRPTNQDPPYRDWWVVEPRGE